MKNTLLFLLFWSQTALFSQQIDPLWCLSEPTDGSSDAYTPLIMMDSFHNVLVFGGIYSPGPAKGFITLKYDSTGNKLWERRHQTSATDFITAAATDQEGAVYVGGVTINNPFGGAGNQIVFKYSATGDTLWQYYLKVPNGVSSSISELLLDESGNLLIFGGYYDTLQSRGGLFVQKKAPDGTELWTASYVADDFGYGAKNARWIGDRWVFWGRNASSANGGTRLLCWQIGTDGQTIATAASTLNPEIIIPLHLDREGSLYLTRGNEYKVVKYSVAAEKEWTFLNPAMPFPQFIEAARLPAIITDQNLNVYATGYIRIDSFHVDAITTKADLYGEKLWEHHITLQTSMQNIAADKLAWLKGDILITSGTTRPNPDSNYYEPFFIFYNPEGYLNGYVSDIEGRRNRITSITSDTHFFYTTGINQKEGGDIDNQFLCKYELDNFVNTAEPNEINSKTSQLRISPNPFRHNFTVFVEHNGDVQAGVLQCCNAQGTVICRKEITLSSGSQYIDIDSPDYLYPGLYHISLQTKDRLYVAKAVKIR